MTAVYRRKYKELKSLGSRLSSKFYQGETVLVTCVDDGKKYVAKRMSLKRTSEKERRAALLEVRLTQTAVLRKLRQPNLVGYHESFTDDTEVILILDQYDEASPASSPIKDRAETQSPHESNSTVEELKYEIEALYRQTHEQEARIKLLQSDCEKMSDKYQNGVRETARLREERGEWERRCKEVVDSLETGLSTWAREFKEKALGGVTYKKSVSPVRPRRGVTHSLAPSYCRKVANNPPSSHHSSLSTPSAVPHVTTELVSFVTPKDTLGVVQSVRERLTSLQKSKATLDAQMMQLQNDLEEEEEVVTERSLEAA